MAQDEFEDLMMKVDDAVTVEDSQVLDGILSEVLANEHNYEMVTMPLLGEAALDATLPVFSDKGGLLTNPAVRFTSLCMATIGNIREIESIYSGESVIREGCVIGGGNRRTRAWAAFLLALYYHTEENAPEAALWAERALGLDTEAAAGWGAWYYLWHAYWGIAVQEERARPSGQPVSDDWINAFAALDWATEVGISVDQKCIHFVDMSQSLKARESAASGFCFQDVRYRTLKARGFMHEDGFTGKFLFENALSYARQDVERVACHQNIVMDILTLRYKREYILQIENATETEIAEALSHCRTSWELAQQLAEAGTFSQEGLREVKGKYDMVRQLIKDQEQLRNMSHTELQELLDKQEQISICQENGDLDRALQLANWCLSRANRNALTWWNKGQILTSKQDLEQAISCFRSALALDPEDSDYYDSLAAALINTRESRHLDEAIRLCQEGLKHNRADESLKRNLALAMERKRGQ